MSSYCNVCGGETEVFHRAVKDHLFDLPGSWAVVRCQAVQCGHGQLDPMPTPSELTGYYARYITHEAADVDASPRRDPISRFLKSRPGHRARRMLFLNDQKPGSVLEIGSGNGVNLLTLKQAGWSVTGQEIDSVAAAGAQSRGLSVKVGFLADVDSDLDEYQAVIMVHVIEHLHRPANELAIALRHIKPRGKLIIITPNFKSFPHRIFGRYWAPLHAPFHLQHFTRASLEAIVRESGFRVQENFTHSTHSASNIRASLDFLRHDQAWFRALARIPFMLRSLEFGLFFALLLIQRIHADTGDECVLIAEPDS